MIKSLGKSLLVCILSYCAKYRIRRYSPLVIGVTGSMGKTSCRMIVSALIKHICPYQTLYTSPKNFNGEIGLPLSILEIESYTPSFLGTLGILCQSLYRMCMVPTYQTIFLEYGIDHPGEMQGMLDIVEPDIAIWTGLDYVHVSQFDSIEAIAQEKSKLVLSAKKLACICIDHPLCQKYVSQIGIDCVTFSTLYPTNIGDIHIISNVVTRHIHHFGSQTQIAVRHHLYHLISNLILDYELIYAGLGCMIGDTIAHRFGHTIQNQDIHITIQTQGGRFTILDGICDSILIDSTYNASPQSMHIALQQTITLAKQHFPDHYKIAILGQMNELDQESKQRHEALVGDIIGYFDAILLYGHDIVTYLKPKLLSAGYLPDSIFTPSDHTHMITQVQTIMKSTSKPCLVFCKGSQGGNYLEEVVKALLVHPEDVYKLVRQDNWRLVKKRNLIYNSK